MDEEEIRVTVIATGLNDIKTLAVNEFFKSESSDIGSDSNNKDNNEKDLFNDLNKNIFSTPAFFRRNKS